MPLRSLLTLLLATSPTVLAAAPASFTDCAAIEDSDDRLLCYDRAAGRYEPAAEPVLPGPPPPQPPRDLPVLAEPEPAERA
ncbi:MAG: phospholipase, partial [Candidatus Competibacteraceae bacterium]|nr:phospholipase [Candidatus Competibacteraceae bacterium]